MRAARSVLLERPLADAAAPEIRDGRIALRLRPFELVTLRLRRAWRPRETQVTFVHVTS
ncbi:hypothetical protein ABZ519_07955 [Streptomyces collinus]|uniref:hypothetical protein n=1 Tax=Streptomyces collinus TaxID=42684 RepID=UPI0033C143B1